MKKFFTTLLAALAFGLAGGAFAQIGRAHV